MYKIFKYILNKDRILNIPHYIKLIVLIGLPPFIVHGTSILPEGDWHIPIYGITLYYYIFLITYVENRTDLGGKNIIYAIFYPVGVPYYILKRVQDARHNKIKFNPKTMQLKEIT